MPSCVIHGWLTRVCSPGPGVKFIAAEIVTPAPVSAACEQMTKLTHVTNLFYVEHRDELARSQRMGDVVRELIDQTQAGHGGLRLLEQSRLRCRTRHDWASRLELGREDNGRWRGLSC